MSLPLVSVIVPTYNNASVLDACLRSIIRQSYKPIELIVVDNNSTDKTKQIAKKYTRRVYSRGPERSAQRNYGVKQAKGEIVLIIDSDMELDKDVVQACVDKLNSDQAIKAIIIPEESFGEGFWAQCKRLERSFYVGVDWIEAARCFYTSLYRELGGYNENMVSGEDWDLSQRAAHIAKIGRVNTYIHHNEGHLSLLRTLKKKYYYARQFASYLAANRQMAPVHSQTSLVNRYKLFLSHPAKLFRNPFYGVGMLFMKTSEFIVGGFGYLNSKLILNRS